MKNIRAKIIKGTRFVGVSLVEVEYEVKSMSEF